jgi:hypothetical protein
MTRFFLLQYKEIDFTKLQFSFQFVMEIFRICNLAPGMCHKLCNPS